MDGSGSLGTSQRSKGKKTVPVRFTIMSGRTKESDSVWTLKEKNQSQVFKKDVLIKKECAYNDIVHFVFFDLTSKVDPTSCSSIACKSVVEPFEVPQRRSHE